MIVIELAGKPLAKERVRTTFKTGHVYTPERTLTYEARLAHVAQLVMDGRAPLPDALVVTMDVRLPVPVSWSQKKKDAALCGALAPTGKPDGDNYAKMLDSLNQIVWIDDAQIIDLRIRKFYSARPGMKIEVCVADIFA